MLRSILTAALVLVGFAATAIADDGAGKTSAPPPQGQAAALRAVSVLLLEFDPKAARALIVPDAVQKQGKPGSAMRLVDELEKFNDAKQPLPAIQEIVFFTADDLPNLRKRFQQDLGVSQMLVEKNRVAKHLDDAFGCLIVTYPLQVGDKGKSAVLALVFKKVEGQYKITYTDDN